MIVHSRYFATKDQQDLLIVGGRYIPRYPVGCPEGIIRGDRYRVQWGYCGERIREFPYTVDGLYLALRFMNGLCRGLSNRGRYPWDLPRLLNPHQANPDRPDGLTYAERDTVETIINEL